MRHDVAAHQKMVTIYSKWVNQPTSGANKGNAILNSQRNLDNPNRRAAVH
ncbi:hypothetical protein GCM10011415_24200 [Salipiger pallidus]|uniref:Uncharacterized protein n=1 Tax=Salipiger pallidus TaxID=1775170 RepID=A0A8J2ZKT4_9RHOB|nr:hypothetical protein GCM10011415_24200 [Salipiger pallidus]